MSETGFSAALSRIERAVGAIEAATDGIAERLTQQSRAPKQLRSQADAHLRTEVKAVIDELDAMLGDRRG